MISAESAAITAQIIEMRDRGLDWRAIGRHVGLSHTACVYRYRAAIDLSDRQRRVHAEALAHTLQEQLDEAVCSIERLRAERDDLRDLWTSAIRECNGLQRQLAESHATIAELARYVKANRADSR